MNEGITCDLPAGQKRAKDYQARIIRVGEPKPSSILWTILGRRVQHQRLKNVTIPGISQLWQKDLHYFEDIRGSSTT